MMSFLAVLAIWWVVGFIFVLLSHIVLNVVHNSEYHWSYITGNDIPLYAFLGFGGPLNFGGLIICVAIYLSGKNWFAKFCAKEWEPFNWSKKNDA